MPKLLTPALSICSHFLQQPEQNTGIDYWSHATEKEYLLHISHKRTMSYAVRLKYQIKFSDNYNNNYLAAATAWL